MKKLEFEISEMDGLFTIHLGGGQWLRFDNITKAKTFERKYKNVMTDNVAMLNLLQPQINSFYRQNIMVLDPTTQRAVSADLKDFDSTFERIFKTFSSGNHNSFVFTNISNCLSSLVSAASVLYDYSKRYKHYGLKASITPVLKNLEMIERQLNLDKKSLFVDNGYKRNKVVNLKNLTADNAKISS